MEKILIKEIVKLAFLLIGPLVILSLLLLDIQPVSIIAFIIGVLLGVLRLKALFKYVISALNSNKLNRDRIPLFKYAASLAFTFGAIVFVIVKSVTIGLAILFGLITVPIIVTIYAVFKGIQLYIKN